MRSPLVSVITISNRPRKKEFVERMVNCQSYPEIDRIYMDTCGSDKTLGEHRNEVISYLRADYLTSSIMMIDVS